MRHMFDAIAPRYELLNAIISLGMGQRWRQRCINSLELPPAARVLDVACGTGDLCRELARRSLVPVGLDLSPGMLREGRAGGRPAPAPMALGDALAAPFRAASFDGAVSGFALRNVADLTKMFFELARLVRGGGRISLLELSQPQAPLLRLGHRLWTSYAVPALGSLLSDAQAYHYLPRSLAYLPPPEEIADLLHLAGFLAIERHVLSGGIAQLFVATRAAGSKTSERPRTIGGPL